MNYYDKVVVCFVFMTVVLCRSEHFTVENKLSLFCDFVTNKDNILLYSIAKTAFDDLSCLLTVFIFHFMVLLKLLFSFCSKECEQYICTSLDWQCCIVY